MENRRRMILPVIVIAQFCCTSLWFAGNGVMQDLMSSFGLNGSALGHLTSSVQFGFIFGTLLFAILTISDRFSPSWVFFVSAILGSVFNLGTLYNGNTLFSLLIFRFLTGFFLAGIYPVGMKIAADHFDKGLGKSLGFLVGALVVGTAFPHLLKGLSASVPWRMVLIITSMIALFGGLLIVVFVPNGPHRKPSQGLDLKALFRVFGEREFRSAAFGYFGHMWELYAFWAFVPFMIAFYTTRHPDIQLNVSVLSFFIIGLGGLACVFGGYLSIKWGAKRVAAISLALSCACCLLSPLVITQSAPWMLILFLIFWGLVVVADSPMFSTLVAQNVVNENTGTALTIVNCIGFSITIVSIQLLNLLKEIMNPAYIFIILAIGPVFGLIFLVKPHIRDHG